jgi:hypothetical protein
MRRYLLSAALSISFAFLPPAVAPAAPPNAEALINEALDQPVNLTLDTVLPKAMATIGEKTGVRIEADPAVWDVLPWGEQTNIKAKIENQTLRSALNAMAQRLGLTTALKAQAVELQPMPALRRLGRRATDQELASLDLLARTPLGLKDNEKPTVEQLVDAVDARLQATKPEFAVEFRRRDMIPLTQQVFVSRNATMLDALESLARETNATWYPWGKSIVVLPRDMQIRNNQLGRTVSIRYNGVDIAQVLLELSKASGVNFEIEAGAIQRIPVDSRNVSLILDNATVAEALETISGFTGLDWVVKGDGVYVWNQSSATGGPGPGQDPVVGMMQLDNGMQLMIRRSSLPPDVREYLEQRVGKEIGKIRVMMKDEGFKPSAPATQPGQPQAQSAGARPATTTGATNH